jgi:hypothetical protein
MVHDQNEILEGLVMWFQASTEHLGTYILVDEGEDYTFTDVLSKFQHSLQRIYVS